MKTVILVPAYQCENTIAETLESLMAQGEALSRVEAVYITDDASTDRTLQIARNVWKSTTELRILDARKNRGEYLNVNEAVAQFPPDVDWFLIMHADNVAKPGWLATFLDRAALTAAETGSICSSWDDLDLDGAIRPGENTSIDKLVHVKGGSRDVVRDTLMKGTWWHISSSIIRVAAYRDVGGLPRGLRLKGDWDFMLRLLSRGWDIEYLPVTLMKYRASPLGSSSLSFALHSDIKEIIKVTGWHQWALSFSNRTLLHAQLGKTMISRCGGALLRGNWKRLVWTLPAMGRIGISYVTCTWAKLTHRPRRDTIPYDVSVAR